VSYPQLACIASESPCFKSAAYQRKIQNSPVYTYTKLAYLYQAKSGKSKSF